MDGLPEPMGDDLHSVRLAEDFLGYAFQDVRLARCALTSPGWCHEHPSAGWATWVALEWQGDAVLYLVLTEQFVAEGAAMTTGRATRQRDVLKSNAVLAERAVDALWPALFLGVGERDNNARDGWGAYVSNSLEALLGAVWFDEVRRGEDPLPAVRRIIRETLGLAR